MKKNILLFSCFLVIAAVSLKAQEIRPMPADSAYGVVHISVCNLREEGKFTSGMSTQALLGMPVKVLQYTGWYEIQTPDDYTGWVHRMVITPMSKERYDEWLLRTTDLRMKNRMKVLNLCPTWLQAIV